MTTPDNDLLAVQAVVEILSPFGEDDRKRIVRWVCEKLNITSLENAIALDLRIAGQPPKRHATQSPKSFLRDKKKLSDARFATAVAYYFHYVAPVDQRKEEIDAKDLDWASDKAGRDRLNDSGHTLRDAKRETYLKSGSRRGTYVIDTAGEEFMTEILAGNSSTTRGEVDG